MSLVPQGEDADARRRSLDTSRSIVLQAPAGSGKTTVLVARYLALLATAGVPEEILAITFTRKAAVEMRNRVLAALRDAEAGADAGGAGTASAATDLQALAGAVLERDRQGDWNLRAQPSRLRIETIDALNQRLARQSPVLSRGAALPPIAANPRVLYRRAARRTLQAAVVEPALAGHATLLFERLDNRWGRVESLLADLLGRRAQWLPVLLAEQPHVLVQRALACVHGIVVGELRLARALIPAALRMESAAVLTQMARHRQREAAAVTPELAAWLEADTLIDPLADSPDDLPRWRLLCATAMTAQGDWRQRLDKRQGVPANEAALKARARQWLEALQSLPGALTRLHAIESLPDAELDAAERAVLLALPPLLQRAAAELELTFAAAGEVDFTAVAAAARASLVSRGEPTDLALRLGAAVHHILVDEFQDTSAEQLDLLRALTAAWQPGEPRSLFMVGDPMQSIYQFRDAEVGLFLQVRDRGLGGLPLQALQLRNNFRSAPALVDWVNDRLGPLFPVQDDVRQSAVRFLSSTAARQLNGQVRIHPSLDHDPLAEAQQVLAIVRRVRREQPDASVAVLVASRRHATVIGGALEQAGVPIRAVRITPLADRAVVRDLLALTRAAQHAGDRTAWLSLLRSPLAGLELPELQQLAEDRNELIPAALERHLAAESFAPETALRLRRVLAALRPALAGVERLLPLSSRIERVWLRLGGISAYAGPQPQADAQRFFAALAADRGAADLTGDDLAPFIDELYATAAGGEGAVEILTMHGAKGLEWDVVIVPGLGLTPQSDSQPLLDCFLLPTDSGDSELLLGTVEATAQRNERSLGAYIRYLRNERRRLEQIRLLYVTATRARRELHWLGAARTTHKGEVCAAAGSLLDALWPSFEPDFAALAAQAQPVTPAPPSAPRARVAAMVRLPADWTVQAGASPPVTRLPVAPIAAVPQPEYSWVGRGARAVGTIVHAELQRLADAGVATFLGNPASLPAPAHYGAWLAQLGVPDRQRRAAGERIHAALRRTLDDPRGLWLLNGALHEEAHSERRLTGLVDGQLVDLVIDRMLVGEGLRWVVDFKTGTHQGGELEAFIEAEVQRYRPQLQRYATLAARLGPQAVQCALYFPLLGLFRPLEL